jgi:hypothetical protein
MTVTFKCGHWVKAERDIKESPCCPVCGERVIKNVIGATPRFSGTCQGPLVKESK